MPSATFTVLVGAETKERLERLASSTGRSRSFLAAEAIDAYLDVNEWQGSGIQAAIASLDAGGGITQVSANDWIASWDDTNETTSRPHPSDDVCLVARSG